MTTTFDTLEESSSSETGAVGAERLVKIRARAYELYLARSMRLFCAQKKRGRQVRRPFGWLAPGYRHS